MIVFSMAKLDGLETVLDFIKGLQPKIAAQIAKKVMLLNVDPFPADYKECSKHRVIFLAKAFSTEANISSASADNTTSYIRTYYSPIFDFTLRNIFFTSLERFNETRYIK